MKTQFNHFFKKAGSKTAYKISPDSREGIIFSSSIYLVRPRYINSTAPAYSLVNSSGQHLTGLFPSGIDNIYLGDFQNRAVIVMTRPEDSIELFLCEAPPVEVKRLLLSGDLNATLLRARKQHQAA